MFQGIVLDEISGRETFQVEVEVVGHCSFLSVCLSVLCWSWN